MTPQAYTHRQVAALHGVRPAVTCPVRLVLLGTERMPVQAVWADGRTLYPITAEFTHWLCPGCHLALVTSDRGDLECFDYDTAVFPRRGRRP